MKRYSISMDTLSELNNKVVVLPLALQQEVLDFADYLVCKTGREWSSDKDTREWFTNSLNLAMCDMADEETPIYQLENLKERF